MTRARLQVLVAERNVRRVVVHVTRRTACELGEAAASQQALDVLRAHGFSVRFAVREESGERSTLATLPSRRQPGITGGRLGSELCSLENAKSALHVVESGLDIDDVVCESRNTGLSSVSLPNAEGTNTLQRLAAEILGLEEVPSSSTVRLFGTHLVSAKQIFYETQSSFCLVNLKPIVPNHVLVIPKRRVHRFELLGADEVSDLWCTAQLVGSIVQRQSGASSLTFAIQDGPEAGQTVQHVHIHVIPRHSSDFEENDQIYDEIESHERRLRVDNERLHGRSLQDMAAEASILAELFTSHIA